MRAGLETGAEAPVKPEQILGQMLNRCRGDAPAVGVIQTGFSPASFTRLASIRFARSATAVAVT